VVAPVKMGAMTSLLTSDDQAARTPLQVHADLRHRRPLVLVATIGGLWAAGGALIVLMAAAVVGWFLTDSGAYGAPRDALRTAATGWLMAHGSGVQVRGTAVSIVPLGLTLLVGWALWRTGHRVGDSISGHGPDADRISDGERDWTVPVAVTLFTLAYAVAVAVTGSMATTSATGLDVPRATTWGLLLALVAGGAGIAVGSGRASVWLLLVPGVVRSALLTAWHVLRAWLAVCLVALVVALALDFSTAANIASQLGTDAGASAIYAVATLAVVPNAMAFAGSYVLGSGFVVGTGTLVAPTAVVLGPLPMFPLLAALPDATTTPSWTRWLALAVPLVAAAAVARVQRRFPTTRWDEGVVRGLAGGVGAGLVFGLLCHLAGGAAGPGRMTEVSPYTVEATIHAVASLGVGGLVAGAAMTWWQRRALASGV
jgi:hypothetical protein